MALRWAFGGLHLHRVEANIQPGTKHRGSACTRSEICVGGSVVRDREPASRAEPSAAGRSPAAAGGRTKRGGPTRPPGGSPGDKSGGGRWGAAPVGSHDGGGRSEPD